MLAQTAGDRDADLRWQLAEFAGKRTQPRERHLTARLATRAAALAPRATATAPGGARARIRAATLRVLNFPRVCDRASVCTFVSYSRDLCELRIYD